MTDTREERNINSAVAPSVEPWLRGTHTEVEAVARQVLHALELTAEDIHRWCANLTDEEMNLRPFNLAPVAFHLRHIARSLDRLLTYAEGRSLDASQHTALSAELAPDATTIGVLEELHAALRISATRIRALAAADYKSPRVVGRGRLPTTLGGLLVHCAEHTQRHAGQAIVTAKVVVGLRSQNTSSLASL